MNDQSIAQAQGGMFEMLRILARYVPGDYTLNQIRVLQYIHMCSRYRGNPTTHVEICRELDLPSATVSRSVARFLEEGSIEEQIDPADGRRRLISATGTLPGVSGDLDRELAKLFL